MLVDVVLYVILYSNQCLSQFYDDFRSTKSCYTLWLFYFDLWFHETFSRDYSQMSSTNHVDVLFHCKDINIKNYLWFTFHQSEYLAKNTDVLSYFLYQLENIVMIRRAHLNFHKTFFAEVFNAVRWRTLIYYLLLNSF